MRILEVLVGMIGSGKSAYAMKRAREGALVVCHDALTAMLHGESRYEPELRECYRRIEESLVWSAFTAGRDVVVDRTHLTREARRRWARWREDYVSVNTFDGHPPEVDLVAVSFPILAAEVHAQRRFDADPRGRPYAEWLDVARHHAEQAALEPLRAFDEGYDGLVAFGVELGFDRLASLEGRAGG